MRRLHKDAVSSAQSIALPLRSVQIEDCRTKTSRHTCMSSCCPSTHPSGLLPFFHPLSVPSIRLSVLTTEASPRTRRVIFTPTVCGQRILITARKEGASLRIFIPSSVYSPSFRRLSLHSSAYLGGSQGSIRLK